MSTRICETRMGRRRAKYCLALLCLGGALCGAQGGTPKDSHAPRPVILDPAHSVARIWDEQMLSSIRIDTPHPPVQARNLFHLSVVMYDAWAAYDPVATGYVYRQKHLGLSAAAVAEARREAISYAAYRMLKERYAYSKSVPKTFAA